MGNNECCPFRISEFSNLYVRHGLCVLRLHARLRAEASPEEEEEGAGEIGSRELPQDTPSRAYRKK